ncbi:hypothetical protein COBT_000856 [Conglomerata obtusa]
MDGKETGIIVISCGTVFLLLGMILVMDTALMAAGNMLIIIGIIITLKSNFMNVFQVKNMQGLIVFCFGVVIIFYRFILFGFLLEIVGLYLLFFDKIPSIKKILTTSVRKIIRSIY